MAIFSRLYANEDRGVVVEVGVGEVSRIIPRIPTEARTRETETFQLQKNFHGNGFKTIAQLNATSRCCTSEKRLFTSALTGSLSVGNEMADGTSLMDRGFGPSHGVLLEKQTKLHGLCKI
jgi:hypothetical protein